MNSTHLKCSLVCVADYASMFAAIGVMATYFGQNVVEFMVKKYKQEAIIVIIIGVVLLVAMLLMSAVGILNVAGGAPVGFGKMCQ
jgi:hypothetical protein